MDNPQTNYVKQHPDLLFGGGHSYVEETLAADINVAYGTLMSIDSSGKLVAFDSSIASAPPLFICINREGLEATADTSIHVLSSGGVYSRTLAFANESDDLDTIYENKRVIDYLREKFVVSTPSENNITC